MNSFLHWDLMGVILWAILVGLIVPPCFSQPVLSGEAVNAASNLPNCAPNGGVAQGAIFVVSGSGLGPAESHQATFPLDTTLRGTSVRVSVSGITINALPLSVSDSRVTALLPSRTPVGTGTVTVSFDNQTSEPVSIKVVRTSFGSFTNDESGSGQIKAENVEETKRISNGTDTPARPGQSVALWGTGLGAVTGDESAGPLQGVQDRAVAVWVGNERARVVSAGRSDCCAGADQIVFEVPQGIIGCYVPIAVESAGIYSNYAEIAISEDGSACVAKAPTLKLDPLKTLGSILMADVDVQVSGFSLLHRQVIDASFEKSSDRSLGSPLAQLSDLYLGGPAVSPGSCIILPPAVRNVDALFTSPIELHSPLDAGQSLQWTGQEGSTDIPQSTPGRYSLTIVNNFLSPGPYQITNGMGTEAVGPISFSATLPSLRWRMTQTRITRSRPLAIQWTGDPAENQLVAIAGWSTAPACGGRSVAFVCYEYASKGQFTIPANILGQLPGSASGALAFTAITPNSERTFSAPGLDLGYYLFLNLQYSPVSFE